MQDENTKDQAGHLDWPREADNHAVADPGVLWDEAGRLNPPVMDSLREGAADLAPSDDAPREGCREGGVPRAADSPCSDPLLEARLTPLTSASERSRSEDSSREGSTLVGPPREYTPVYVDCSHHTPNSILLLAMIRQRLQEAESLQ